jgi:hypothetical protein
VINQHHGGKVNLIKPENLVRKQNPGAKEKERKRIDAS